MTDQTTPPAAALDMAAIRREHQPMRSFRGEFCSRCCACNSIHPCPTIRLCDALDAERKRAQAAERERDRVKIELDNLGDWATRTGLAYQKIEETCWAAEAARDAALSEVESMRLALAEALRENVGLREVLTNGLIIEIQESAQEQP